MEKLDNLLVPKEEIQEEPETKEEAMDCTEDTKEGAKEVKEERESNKTIKFGKTDEEYEEKLASGGDGPSSSSKKSSEKKPKKEKGQMSVMDMFKRAPPKKEVKRKSSEKEGEQEQKRSKEEGEDGPELREREKVVVAVEKPKIERCSTCRQLVEQAPQYLGHPNEAVEEFVGIVDKRLSLFEDGEETNNHKII